MSIRSSIARLLALPLALAACGAPPDSASTTDGRSPTGLQPLQGILRGPGGAMEVLYAVTPSGLAIHDGDVLLGRADDVSREWEAWQAAGAPDLATWGANDPSTLNSYGYPLDPATSSARLHSGGTVCYIVDPGVSLADVSAATAAWTNKWNNASPRPRFWNTSNCSHVVVFTPVNPADEAIGFCGFSALGKENQFQLGFASAQYVYVPSSSSTPNCSANRQLAMQHEIGHLLGLGHEHQRPDRDTYVRVNVPVPIPNWWAGAFGAPAAAPPNGSYYTTGPYDLRSIMHYASSMTLANGDPLPNPGPLQTISKGDVAAVIGMYTPGSTEPTFIFGDRPGLGSGATRGGTHSDTRGVAAAGDATGVMAVAGGDLALWANGRAPQCGGFCGWLRLGGIIHSPPGIGMTPGRGWGFVVAAMGSNPSNEMCLWDDQTWICDKWGAAMPSHASTGYDFLKTRPAVIGTPAGSVFLMAHAFNPSTGALGLLSIWRNPDKSWGSWTVVQANDVKAGPALVRDSTLIGWIWVAQSDGGLHSLGGGSSFSNFPQGTKPPNVSIAPNGVSASSRGPGHIEIFVSGDDGLIWGLVRQNGVWGPWKVYGGPLASDSVPAVMPDTRVSSGSATHIPVRLFFQEAIFPDSATNPGAFDFGGVRNLIWTTKIRPL